MIFPFLQGLIISITLFSGLGSCSQNLASGELMAIEVLDSDTYGESSYYVFYFGDLVMYESQYQF
jgi:hypothetical protein